MIRFYVDVVGCRLERSVPGIGLFHLRAGASQIDLVEAGSAPPDLGRRNVDHVCLRVEPFDARAIAERFARHGVEVSEVKERFGAEGTGPSVYVSDPEGNVLELKGPPAPAGAAS